MCEVVVSGSELSCNLSDLSVDIVAGESAAVPADSPEDYLLSLRPAPVSTLPQVVFSPTPRTITANTLNRASATEMAR